jgi:hypothetical protein
VENRSPRYLLGLSSGLWSDKAGSAPTPAPGSGSEAQLTGRVLMADPGSRHVERSESGSVQQVLVWVADQSPARGLG